MPDYICIVQEDQEPHRKREPLANGLRRLGQERFGDDPASVDIQWNVVAKGFGWTAGEPSTSSIVIRSVPVGYPNEEREAFLREVCDLWTSVAGCTVDEIVATAWDGPLPG